MKLFYEKYIKLAHIGKGANAHVYKVKHVELGYVRAIKILNDYIEDKNEKAYQTFLKECKTLLAIGNGSHPNIVHIYGPDLIENRAIVEMDYIEGSTLDSYIKKNGFIEYDEVLSFIHDIVGALAYTHHDIYKFLMNPEEDDLQADSNDGSRFVISPEKESLLVKKYGIAHNDLHSNNVMRRDYDGSFVLLDFGLAVQDGECVKSSGKSAGSPEYIAPEKFDSDEITPRSDVYSLGVLLYELLTGQPPFVLLVGSDGNISLAALNKIRNEHHKQSPQAILPLRKAAFERLIPGAVYERDYPEWLDDIVMKCLAKRPEDRFSDAREMLDEINCHLEKDKTGETRPKQNSPQGLVNPPIENANNYNEKGEDQALSKEAKLTKKRKNPAFLLAGVCLLLTLVAGLLLFNNKDSYIPVEEITMPSNEYSLNVGDSLILMPKVFPANATDTTVLWASSNPDILAVINNRFCKAVKSGIATLTATSMDGKTTAQFPVSISPDESHKLENKDNSENTKSEESSQVLSNNVVKETKMDNISSSNGNNSSDHKSASVSISFPSTIQEALNMLINNDITREERLNSIPQIINIFFEPSAKVRTLSDADITLDYENAEDFLRRIALSRKISRIEIAGSEKRNKITELSVRETR